MPAGSIGRSVRIRKSPTRCVPLRERGLQLAVCSNWDWDLEPAIAEAGLEDAFDLVVSSAWAGARKPHPRIFRHTLSLLELAPADVVFVGDTWGPDVEGPRAVGMCACYLERDGHWADTTLPTVPRPTCCASPTSPPSSSSCDPHVGKPSERTPHTSAAIADHVARFLDPSAVVIVEGGPDTTQALLAERFDHIFYTGSGRRRTPS